MRKDLVLIFGPPAVGKMTVGKELEKLIGFRLFHNHMAIELSLNFFNYGEDSHSRVVEGIRHTIFREFINGYGSGLIFTFVWHLDDDYGQKYIRYLEKMGYKVHLVELKADAESLYKRNTNLDRIKEKPSKGDVNASERHLSEVLLQNKVNTCDNDIVRKVFQRYICIDNTNITPAAVANIIVKKFFGDNNSSNIEELSRECLQ